MIDAAGTVLLNATGTVSLAGAHSLLLGGVTGSSVTIAANGSIMDVSPAGAQMITADKAVLYAIDGIIGGSFAKTNINYFSGFADAIYLQTSARWSLAPFRLMAGHLLSPAARNTMAGGYLQAPSIELTAGGAIGTPGAPVIVNTQSLTASGGNLYFSSIGHLNRVDLTGGSVVLSVGGNLTGGIIRAKNLTLIAFGSIGTAQNPLRLVVPGALIITSLYGEIFYTNQLIRSTFLVGLLLGGDIPMMLLIRFGQTIQGGLVVMNILMVRLDDLSGFGDVLAGAGIRSLDMALIEGANGSSLALAKALLAAFPKVKIASLALFWIAQMRPLIEEDEWSAMLSDLEAIYRATTEQALTDAVEAFTERWQAAYPEITARLNQEATDSLTMLEAFDLMHRSELDLTMLLNALSEVLAQTSLS
jgi:hypothetical protein